MSGPLRYHYAPTEQDGVVQDYYLPVTVPHPETGEADGTACETVRVVVYLTREHMVQDACAYNGQTPEDLGEAEGVTNCVEGPQVLCDDGDEPRATIRMHLGMLTRSVALHELVHASHAVYRWHYLAMADYNPWGPANEAHAYMLQTLWEMVEATTRWESSLHPKGPHATYWDDVTA